MTAKRKVAVCTSWTFQDPIVQSGLTKAQWRATPFPNTRLRAPCGLEMENDMHRSLIQALSPARGSSSPHTLVSPSAFGQPLRANRGACEGAKQTWHVTYMHGKIVGWKSSQSIVDIRPVRRSGPVQAAPRDRVQGRACNGGGSGHAHKPREGADASGASDRTRHPCQDRRIGNRSRSLAPITVCRLSTSSKNDQKMVTPSANEAIVLDRVKSFIQHLASHVGGPIFASTRLDCSSK